MFSYFQHPDWGTRSLLFVFTVGSAVLSAYCGWSLAGQSGFVVQVFWAGILGCIPLALGNAVIRSSRYRSAGDIAGFQRMLVIAFLLTPLNIVTDYGASSVIRDKTTVAAKNTNTNAKQLQERRARLMAEKVNVEKVINEGLTLPSSSSFDAEINAAQLAVDLEAGRGGCKDKCLARKRELAQLKQQQGIAKRREDAEKRLIAINMELKGAEVKFEKTGFESNPALAQIKKIVSWATLSLDHSQEQVSWGENSFMLITTLALTAAISFFGWEMGQRHGAMADAPQWARNRELADRRADEGRYVDPKTTAQHGRDVYVLKSETIKKKDRDLAMARALERWAETA